MTTQERFDLNATMAVVLDLQKRVNSLELELQELRDAVAIHDNDDAPRSLASVIGEAADYQRYMKTH